MDETYLPPPTGERRDLLERLLTRAESTDPVPTEGSPSGDASATENRSAGDGSAPAAPAVGGDPSALLSLLPALTSLLGGGASVGGASVGGASVGGASAGGASAGGDSRPAGSAPSAGLPATPSRGGSGNRHTALLCAVKPYLTPQRQEAADTILRLCRLWDSLAASGLLEALPALLSPMGGVTPTEGGESRVQ